MLLPSFMVRRLDIREDMIENLRRHGSAEEVSLDGKFLRRSIVLLLYALGRTSWILVLH